MPSYIPHSPHTSDTLPGSQAFALIRSFLVAGVRHYRINAIPFLKEIKSITHTHTFPIFGSAYKETKIYLLDFSEKVVVRGK